MKTDAGQIILHAPMNLTVREFARLCRIDERSSAFEAVEEALPLINRYGAPKAILRRVDVDRVEGDLTTVEGTTFQSRIVADKLRGLPWVFLSVVTAGDELDRCEDLEDDPFLDIFKGALLARGTEYAEQIMRERYRFDGSSTLNLGSLPDWPIGNNFALFALIGNTEQIGVSLNGAGYMRPWNTVSRIHFPGNGYVNCSLCREFDCPRRRAAFNAEEYRRIFGQ